LSLKYDPVAVAEALEQVKNNNNSDNDNNNLNCPLTQVILFAPLRFVALNLFPLFYNRLSVFLLL